MKITILHPRSITRLSCPCLAVMMILLLLGGSCLQAVEELKFNRKEVGGLSVVENGSGLQQSLASAGEKYSGVASVAETITAGWHKITAEYRTVNFTPVGSFVLQVSTKDKDCVTPWQLLPAASNWQPAEAFFYLKIDQKIYLNLIAEPDKKRRSDNAEINIRNVKIEPYITTVDRELLGNGDFSMGSIGEIPPLWYWQYHGEVGDYGLVPDGSFRTSKQTVEVKVEEGGKPRTLSGTSRPMDLAGQVIFSVWAKAEGSDISMTLRLCGNKYKWLKSVTTRLTPTWTKYTLAFEIPLDMEPALYFPRIDVSGAGSARLAGASLMVKAVAEAEKSDVPTSGAAANLLANADFELGWNGWMLDIFGPKNAQEFADLATTPECRIIPDAAADGGAAMALTNMGTSLVSSCIPISKGKAYTFSVDVKAQGADSKLKLYLIDTGWKIKMQECAGMPAGEWKRISMRVNWDYASPSKRAYVRLDGKDVLIDKVQLVEGDAITYQAPGLTMGVVAPEGNIFTKGEAIKGVALKVFPSAGAPETIRLVSDVSDAWGKVLWKKESTVSGKAPASVPLDLPGDKLGVLSITSTAFAADQRVLGKAQSRYAVVVPPVKSNRELPIFGTHHDILASPDWLNQNYLKTLKQMGAGINRYYVSKGALSGKGIESTLQAKFTKINEMFTGPQIICVDGTRKILEDISAGDVVSKEALEAYLAFLKSYVVPLQKQVKYWEILNEPNIWTYADGPNRGKHSMTPEKYVSILKASYEMIKGINPDLKVMGACLNGADFEYLDKIMKLGAGKYMDIYSFHGYRGSPDFPDTYSDLLRYKKILKDNGFNGPTVSTEQYYASNLYMMHGSDGETRANYYVPGDEELWGCALTVHNYLHHAAAGIPLCSFAPQLTEVNYGGFDPYFLFYLYGAYSAESALLSNAGEGTPVKLGDSVKAFLFKGAPEGPILAYYTPDPKLSGRLKLSGKFNAFDMMGNPLSADDIREGLPVSVTPVYVRYAKETSGEKIVESLATAETSGLGNPFDFKVRAQDANALGIVLVNKQNKPLSGNVSILSIPDSWKIEKTSMPFASLKANDSICIDFKGEVPMVDLADYKIELAASSGDLFLKKEILISPVFAECRKEIKVDGSLSDWEGASWINLGEDKLSTDFGHGKHTGSADLSARLACAWNERFVAFALEVTDDVATYPQSPDSAWSSDSVQIYFDQLKNAVRASSQSDGDDLTYAISSLAGTRPYAYLEKGCDGRYVGEANQATGIDSDVEVAVVRSGSKTIFEIKFPSKCFPMIAFEPGLEIGFSILINDNDGAGRKAGLTLAPKGSEPFNKPFYFKSLILRKDLNTK